MLPIPATKKRRVEACDAAGELQYRDQFSVVRGEVIKQSSGLRQELFEVAGDLDGGGQDEHGSRHAAPDALRKTSVQQLPSRWDM